MVANIVSFSPLQAAEYRPNLLSAIESEGATAIPGLPSFPSLQLSAARSMGLTEEPGGFDK